METRNTGYAYRPTTKSKDDRGSRRHSGFNPGFNYNDNKKAMGIQHIYFLHNMDSVHYIYRDETTVPTDKRDDGRFKNLTIRHRIITDR